MNSIIKTSKENICFDGSEYVTHEIIRKGVDLPIYSLKIYFRSGISTVTCLLSYHEAVSLSNEIGALMKEFKKGSGEEAVERKTFQERLDEEAEKKQKPKAEINTIEQELILEKIDILKDYFFHAYKIYQTIGKDDFLFAKNILWALAKKIKLPNVNENIASFVPIECLDNLVEFIENTIDTIKSSEGPVSKYEIEKVLGTFTYTAKSIIESSYPNYLIDYLAWGNRKDIHQGGNSGDENGKEEESSKKQKPKAYTLDEVKDEMIGEKGTTERDKYEKRLLINLFAEKVANICKEVVPEYIVKDNGNEYRFTFDMYDLRKKVFEARDQFLADIEAKEKVHAPL